MTPITDAEAEAWTVRMRRIARRSFVSRGFWPDWSWYEDVVQSAWVAALEQYDTADVRVPFPIYLSWKVKSGLLHLPRVYHAWWKMHRRQFTTGTSHPRAKCDAATVRAIRALQGVESAPVVAKRYELSVCTVYYIWQRRRYASVS